MNFSQRRLLLSLGVAFCCLTIAHGQPASRDPKISSSVNPKINSSINPDINSAISPNINSSLNPDINSSINPSINSSINPRINSATNPKINSALNPDINSSINPKISRNLRGMYLWNQSGNPTGLLIYANRSFLLWYSAGEWQGYAASNGSDGFNLFDVDGEWVGYLLIPMSVQDEPICGML